MTKEQFKRIASDGVERILMISDDLWDTGFPMISFTVNDHGSRVRVVIGIEEADNGEDGDHC